MIEIMSEVRIVNICTTIVKRNNGIGFGSWACFSVSLLCFFLANTSIANETPNIILLMGDDHGWDETAYNGHPHLKWLIQASASTAFIQHILPVHRPEEAF